MKALVHHGPGDKAWEDGVIVAPRGRQLHCPAHDALFTATTGAVEQGPADRALTKIAVSVVGGRVLTA